MVSFAVNRADKSTYSAYHFPYSNLQFVLGALYHDFHSLVDENISLQKQVDKHIKWFKNNTEDTRLDNHELTGHMAGKWAFSVTGDIRIIYSWTSKTSVRFLAIGGHRDVYRKE